MEIVEGNKLIAEFMGDKGHDMLSYQYHSSWDWLMPVVERIGEMPSINFNLSSFDGAVFYDDDYKHTASGNRIAKKENTMIQSTWLAVVEFIRWHNHQSGK
jgi:hypothetical protein